MFQSPVLVLFERNIAFASILILAVGDSVAPFVGRHLGKVKNPLNPTRLIEGTIAGAIAGALAAMFFVSFWHALIASTIAMTVEAIELTLKNKKIDDNILIPLVSGAVLWAIKFLGY